MSESENDATPRFNKAVVGRIVAVVVFVGLGTFAVIQSIKSKPPTAVVEEDSDNKNGPDKNGPDTSLAEDDKNKSNPTPKKTDRSNEKSKLVNSFPPASKAQQLLAKNDSASKTAASKTEGSFGVVPNPSQPGFGNSSRKPATTRPALPKGNQFGPLPTGNTPKITALPDTKKPNAFPAKPNSKSFPISQPDLPKIANTQTKPPERFAQAPGGKPIYGNNSGFGSRPKLPSDPAIRADVTTKKTPPVLPKNPAQDLVNDAKKSTADFLDKSSKQLAGTAIAAKSAADQLGPKPGINTAFRGLPAPKSFTPPDVQSHFGGPNTSEKKPAGPPPIQTSFGGAPKNPTKNVAPVAPIIQPDNQNTGANSRTIITQNPGNKTNNSYSKPIADSKTGQSPFGGGVNVTSSTRSDTANRPLRTPTSTANPNFPSTPRLAPSIDSKSAFSPPNQRSTGGGNSLERNNASIPAIPSGLAQSVPGERQLEGVQAAALTVEKLSPNEIQVDQPADFQLVIKNVGRVAAEDVRVFDRIPNGTQFLGASPEPISQSRNGEVQWNIGKLRPGQETRIKFQLKPTRPGEIGSVAQVAFSTQASMRTLVTRPILEIVHQSKPTHLIGDDVILDVIVKNKGDGAAKNVLIQEDVPKQLEFQDGYRELEYEIGTLMPGQSRRIQLALKAAQVGKLRNVMFASAAGGLQTKHELPMEIIAPKLVARSSGPTRRFIQRNVSHEFSVINNGTAPAKNVELVARLPRGLRFVSANNQGLYDARSNAVYWKLAELARGIEAKVELKTLPVEVGSQPIKFESTADLNVKSNVEQALSVEHLVDVFFEIDDVVDAIEIGSNTSYRVRVVNQGTKAATNVQLQVDFPTGIAPTSVDGSLRHSVAGQRVVFEPITSLSPGEQIAVVINGRGITAGDHRVVAKMKTDGRLTPVSKEESTRVYSDR